MNKSTVEEIRARFDADVERFSNLETGQSATMDAPIAMELVARAAAACSPHARDALDVGCGAGNYALKVLQYLPNLNWTLVDLSLPMIERAVERVSAATAGTVTPLQADIREAEFAPESFDVIVAAASLHHLRGEDEWHATFAKFFQSLRSGGSLWIFDHVEGSTPQMQALMQERWGAYLTDFRDEAYRDTVFEYTEKEDTPRPLMFQLDALRGAGFEDLEVLHKNSHFVAFGGVKK
ncbi:MAG TPA: class I SAM-dependent methyltransferase [Abditibacteriaceae bacterium]|jgi:tRNA (cmo5U34)-methyltransferase